MNIYYNLGDALTGERILAQARRISVPKHIKIEGVVNKQTKLTGSVFCIIDKPLIIKR